MLIWLWYFLALLGVFAIGVLIVAATRPNEFRVERSIVIHAPRAAIYPLLIDFREGEKWSPWERLDPNMKKTRSGPPAGIGSVHEWSGNEKVGEGRLEIIAAQPEESVTLRLEFLKPWQCRNTVIYALTEEETATRMTWSMIGPQPFLGKVMCLFMNMDRMVGRDFEAGLIALKSLAERSRES